LFSGIAEKLHVPLAAIKAFADPSVQFTLQFETLAETMDETEEEEAAASAEPPEAKRMRPARSETLPAAAPESREQPNDKPGDKASAEVVRLDRFRKK